MIYVQQSDRLVLKIHRWSNK